MAHGSSDERELRGRRAGGTLCFRRDSSTRAVLLQRAPWSRRNGRGRADYNSLFGGGGASEPAPRPSRCIPNLKGLPSRTVKSAGT